MQSKDVTTVTVLKHGRSCALTRSWKFWRGVRRRSAALGSHRA